MNALLNKLRFLALPLTLIFALTLTSCIEIYENIKFKKDGSGSAEFIYDFSGLMSLMDMAPPSEETETADAPAKENEGEAFWKQLDHTYDSLSTEYKKISSIRNFVYTPDRENNRFIMRFDFDNVGALNDFLNKGTSLDQLTRSELLEVGDKEEVFDHFTWKKGVVSRRYRDVKEKKTEEKEKDESLALAENMLGSMNYHINYTFENGVKKVSGEKAAWSSGSNEVTVDYTLDQALKGAKGLNFSVKSK